ncbi:MAG: phospholipid scramblase-related protein [Polyangiales bacterium]
MKCPRCGAAMGPLDAEEGVVVDTCTACRAAWFDRGELARVAHTPDDLPALDAASELSRATAMPCPRCAGASLVEMPYAVGHPVLVATCPMCQGVLASLGDLRAMRALASPVRAPAATLAAPGDHAALDRVAARFDDVRRLSVRQRRSWLEALTGFEQANQYTVLANGGGAAFVVQEQTRGLGEALVRLLLGPFRPFESYVEDTRRGTVAMKLRRPFRWFLPEMEVRDADGSLMARIARRWTLVATRYDVLDAAGALIGEIHGPFFRPWTFELRAGGVLVACVRKRWSGLVSEVFTDADNFEVTFEANVPPRWKPLALAAAVLIDAAHFERSNA